MNQIVDSLITRLKKRFRILFSKEYRREQHYSKLLQKSEYFDATWYLSEYPDISDAQVVAEEHYIKNGYVEGRLPGPKFDEELYLDQIPHTVRPDLPPIIHYELYGRYQGITPEKKLAPKIWWRNIKTSNFTLARKQIAHDLTSKPVTIIIPIFNGAHFVKKCLDSVLHLKGDFKVIAVDDSSEEVEMTDILRGYANRSNVKILKNPENQGFTKTVNKGIQEAGYSDIIILNSDTLVPKTLIVNLKYAAYCDERTGTVTPLSNSAGPFSIHFEETGAIRYSNSDDITRLLSQGIASEAVEVPTGHGFCMYIKSAVFESTGFLDEEAFPRGYGEENDFCFKARLAGWKNIVDSRTYVFHEGAKSFKAQKQSLLKTGLAKLNERYDDYDIQIQKGFSSQAFQFMKKRVSFLTDNLERLHSRCKPRILFVIATEQGGTAKTNKDLMGAIQDKYETFLLKSNSRRVSLYLFNGGEELHLQTCYLNSAITPVTHISSEYDNLLLDLLHLWSIELIHVRQIAWHSLGLVKVAQKLGIPTVYSIHDFYPVCPSVKLLDNSNNYCGGTCTPGLGMCNIELWSEKYFTNLKHNEIKSWRSMFSEMLIGVNSLITTSDFAKQVTTQNLPITLDKPFHIIPHGRDFTSFACASKRPSEEKNIRLLMLGTIVKSKGSDFILPILEEFSNVEVHLLGELLDTNISHPRLYYHGTYKRDELHLAIEKINPSWGLLLSIWPETWCHTLTEMWANGIPVIAFNNGAVEERIVVSKCGVLVKNSDLKDLFKTLYNVLNPEVWHVYVGNVIQWQHGTGKIQNVKEMSFQYTKIYNDILTDKIVAN